MKKILFSAALVLACSMSLSAQDKNGGISEQMLTRIRQGYTATPEQKAAKNALAINPISELVVNADNAAMCDTHFSHRVITKGITNQKKSQTNFHLDVAGCLQVLTC